MNYFLKIEQSFLDREMRFIEKQSRELEKTISNLEDIKLIIDDGLENINDLIRKADMEAYENEE